MKNLKSNSADVLSSALCLAAQSHARGVTSDIIRVYDQKGRHLVVTAQPSDTTSIRGVVRLMKATNAPRVIYFAYISDSRVTIGIDLPTGHQRALYVDSLEPCDSIPPVLCQMLEVLRLAVRHNTRSSKT